MSVAEQPFGASKAGWLDHAVIALTSSLPNNWLGLRLAIGLRRIVTMRRPADQFDVVRWGLRMRLHPRDNGCEKNLLFTPQMYDVVERAEIAADIERISTEGRPFVFLDIGANVGLYSLSVASLAQSRAEIVAVEPEPGNVRRLAFNINANGHLPIRLFPVALGSARGETAIIPNCSDRGGTRVRDVMPSDADSVRVTCLPLLDLLRDNNFTHVDTLKIDVEGAEDKVLAPFFRDAPPSLWPDMIVIEDGRHEWTIDLLELFTAKGYAVTNRSRQNLILRRAH